MPTSIQGTSIVGEIEIAAPAKTVWKALTNAKELTRWLPLSAHVKAGKGGKMHLSWGEPVVQESTIEAWVPNKHLRLKEVRPFGAPYQPKKLKNVTREIDFKLTPNGAANTTLRLEHTNVAGKGAGMAAFSKSLADCWAFQLNSLDVYATQHLGKQRTVSWARAVSKHSFPATWKKVMGRMGLLHGGKKLTAKAAPGHKFDFKAVNGDKFEGTVLTHTPNKQFAGVVENLNNSVLRVVLDHCGGKPETTVWLATYGPVPEAAKLFEHRWTHTLQTLLQ